eukprot:264801-Rhodomonas_salina.2
MFEEVPVQVQGSGSRELQVAGGTADPSDHERATAKVERSESPVPGQHRAGTHASIPGFKIQYAYPGLYMSRSSTTGRGSRVLQKKSPSFQVRGHGPVAASGNLRGLKARRDAD